MSEQTLLMESPVGPLRLATDGVALTRTHFVAMVDVPHPDSPAMPRLSPARTARGTPDPVPPVPDGSEPHPVLVEARRQLEAYFAGRLRVFDLPLAARGTDFQQRVWAQLRTIPYGTTSSYADVAARLGLSTTASRAVGLANGANPIAIIVPCHRVIGSDGTLVGYAGGLQRKRLLLELESPVVQEVLFGD